MQVWGPLIFESRRFVELRQKSLWQQITSAESTGLGLFYTLNIFCIQVMADSALSRTLTHNSDQSFSAWPQNPFLDLQLCSHSLVDTVTLDPLEVDMHQTEAFCGLQFYLGTTRLQLEHKGDTNHHFTSFANIVPVFGFLGIPFMSYLLDKKGYGVTMATINFLTVLASLCEAMPSLRFQASLSTALFHFAPDLEVDN